MRLPCPLHLCGDGGGRPAATPSGTGSSVDTGPPGGRGASCRRGRPSTAWPLWPWMKRRRMPRISSCQMARTCFKSKTSAPDSYRPGALFMGKRDKTSPAARGRAGFAMIVKHICFTEKTAVRKSGKCRGIPPESPVNRGTGGTRASTSARTCSRHSPRSPGQPDAIQPAILHHLRLPEAPGGDGRECPPGCRW